jgi:diguanylate cyclase (GGDEF)-like protein/PAS domain S-box-containing protein
MANRILIISASPPDIGALKKALGRASDGPYVIETASRLSQAMARLAHGGIDAILADLTLPDSQGIDTFDKLFATARHTPIMALSATADEPLAVEAVQRGAQGYLSKGYFESYLVPQALRNIIQRKAVEEGLYVAQARAEITLNSISDAVISTDMSGNVDYLNISAEHMTGWTRDEARSRPIHEVLRIVNAVTRKHERNPVELVLQQDESMGMNAETILVRRDGREIAIEDSASPIHDWDGRICGAVVVFHDISATQAMSLKMAHLAQHDFLTGLPNRVLLNDRIAQAIAMARRRGAHLAVLFLDLDNFKNINDSLGHAVGDKLLQSVARRLAGCVRDSDTVSRQGGDEFVILLAEDRRAEDAALAAEKILAAMALPHALGELELHVSTSIGVSVYPADGQDADALIKNADTAMYHAKEKGRNNYQFFRNDMNIRAVERQLIESQLRRALDQQEFVLHYQPKVNLTTGEITGVEALIRWQHPEWGTVLPERFIPVAEDCGLIVPIGRWVLREACLQAQRWENAGIKPVSVAVNISSLEFRRKDFFDSVRAALDDIGLDPHCLQLEITESILMRDVDTSNAILRQFKNFGVQLAVDDFGTGYSSLSYLKQFPIDVLKIDQSFVRDIDPDQPDNGIIVSAVISMGTSLHQRVIAEGVENQRQLDFLRARHCDEAQGYLFSRPLAADKFTALLASGVHGMPLH